MPAIFSKRTRYILGLRAREFAMAGALIAAPFGFSQIAFATPTGPEITQRMEEPRVLTYNMARGFTQSSTLRITHHAETLTDTAPLQPEYELRVPLRLEVQSIDDDGAFVLVRTLGTPSYQLETTRQPGDQARIAEAIAEFRSVETFSAQGDLQTSDTSLAVDGLPLGTLDIIPDLVRAGTPPLPREPMTSGDTWAQNIPMEFASKDDDSQGVMNVIYTLEGEVRHEGRRLLKLTVSIDAEFAGTTTTATRRPDPIEARGTIAGEGYLLLDPDTMLYQDMELRLGTVMMLGTRDATRRRQIYETNVSIR